MIHIFHKKHPYCLRVLAQSIAKLKLVLSRGHCDLDLCPWCHLLVRTNIPSKFEGPSPKHCQVIKHFNTKGQGDLNHDLCPWCHLLVRTNIPSKFEGSSPKHCQAIKDPGDLDFCPQDNLLVRTNISTKFEGPNHKHCRTVNFFGTQGHGDLDL